ncbi:MAG TPA: bacteriohemerythrin [Acetobacteraceae bacterium]|jgi:hemerythrin-like metal-binding protein
MSLIQWSDAFRTGFASVDYEHAQLIELLNRLHAAIGQQNAAAVADFLGDLHDAIAAHFALEESLMHSRGYAGYAAHKADHERLLDEIRTIMDEHDASEPADVIESLRPRLAVWFMRHFQTEDAKLHSVLQPD